MARDERLQSKDGRLDTQFAPKGPSANKRKGHFDESAFSMESLPQYNPRKASKYSKGSIASGGVRRSIESENAFQRSNSYRGAGHYTEAPNDPYRAHHQSRMDHPNPVDNGQQEDIISQPGRGSKEWRSSRKPADNGQRGEKTV